MRIGGLVFDYEDDEGRATWPMIVVAKVGSSSITTDSGEIDEAAIAKFCDEVALRAAHGHRVVMVTSGAIAAGLPALGLSSGPAPRRRHAPGRLRGGAEPAHAGLRRGPGPGGLIGGQVLLAPLDFMVRQQYLHARSTLTRLLELGVVPVVNENDAIADDEIRFGDNDRMAALVAHLVSADLLVLLTDQPGLLTGDPRSDAEASLIEEIVEVDHTLERMAGGAGSDRGSGGMASKLAAAKIAAWSGVRAVIAQADRDNVLVEAVAGRTGVGTVVVPRPAGCRPASCGSPSPSARRASWSSTTGPSGRCWSGACRCCRRG